MQCLSNRRWDFKIVVPLLHPRCDLQLPAGFIKTSSTPSVSIKLDPNRSNNEIIGVAMVFCLAPSSPGDYSHCHIRVGINNIPNHTEEVHIISNQIAHSLDHLVLYYMPYYKLPTRQLESPNCDKLEFFFLLWNWSSFIVYTLRCPFDIWKWHRHIKGNYQQLQRRVSSSNRLCAFVKKVNETYHKKLKIYLLQYFLKF